MTGKRDSIIDCKTRIYEGLTEGAVRLESHPRKNMRIHEEWVEINFSNRRSIFDEVWLDVDEVEWREREMVRFFLEVRRTVFGIEDYDCSLRFWNFVVPKSFCMHSFPEMSHNHIITLSSQGEATSSLWPNYTQLTEGSTDVKMGVKVGETLVSKADSYSPLITLCVTLSFHNAPL